MVLPPAPARKEVFAHVWTGVPETMPATAGMVTVRGWWPGRRMGQAATSWRRAGLPTGLPSAFVHMF
jgi:hypothetical protein